MQNTEKRIQQIEKQIQERHIQNEKSLLITEMKKIGIEKLPYSYTALKQSIDPETMNFHYNKHYKGYVDKLNDALSKKKKGDVDLENIIKNIDRYDKTIRNNAGGAFNHALFWNMLTPKPKKLEGELFEKITKEFGTFTNFKKKFETIAKDRFGSGWVWLILTPKNQLKIMSTPNQDNPFMNVIEGGGFPLLGLDLWEHAYYLKYKNKRDEYISNFWKVVNWEFVSKLFEMKVETKLLEQIEFKKLIDEKDTAQFCSKDDVSVYKEILFDETMKRIYIKAITNSLRKVFGDAWAEQTNDTMSGFYNLESEGRSVLNNLNTNHNTFCLMVKAVNNLIQGRGKPEKIFNFYDEKKRTPQEIIRFGKALDYFANKLYSKENSEFINILKVLLKTWKRGEDSENSVLKKIDLYFEGDATIEKTSGAGKKLDAIKGVDLTITINDRVHTCQVKPYNYFKTAKDTYIIFTDADVKEYNVNWMIFFQTKSNHVLIFKNDCKILNGRYIFPKNALLHEIE